MKEYCVCRLTGSDHVTRHKVFSIEEAKMFGIEPVFRGTHQECLEETGKLNQSIK